MPALAPANLVGSTATGAPLGLSTATAPAGILQVPNLPDAQIHSVLGWTYSWPFTSTSLTSTSAPLASVSLGAAMKTAALAFLALSGVVGTGGPAVPALRANGGAGTSVGTGTDVGAGANAGVSTDVGVNANVGVNVGTSTGTNWNANAGASMNANAVANTNAVASTNVGANVGAGTNVGAGANIVLTNDDGWAVAQIRAQAAALAGAGFNVVLSAPAQDQSGTGSATSTPAPLTAPCEFDSCPAGSPAEGFNASDPRLNYVNGFPVDAARYGIHTLAPRFFDGAGPDLVVSGPNVGHNTGLAVLGSGTIGAAASAASLGLPALAVSGTGTAHEAWTALTSPSAPTSPTVSAAHANAALTLRLVRALLAASAAASAPGPLLPPGVFLNVNFPSLSLPSPSNASSNTSSSTPPCTPTTTTFILTRLLPLPLPFPPDVTTCANHGRLPAESTVLTTPGCFASVSAVDARTKLDAGRAAQAGVLARLGGVLGCLPTES